MTVTCISRMAAVNATAKTKYRAIWQYSEEQDGGTTEGSKFFDPGGM